MTRKSKSAEEIAAISGAPLEKIREGIRSIHLPEGFETPGSSRD